VKIISHRAYIDGADPNVENCPMAIQTLLDSGLHVEIDVWYIDGEYILGHDSPKYQIQEAFLEQEGLWCHAKNKDALERMLASGVHCFWHQEDDYTITSKGYIWAYPSKETSGKNTVLLFPERYAEIEYSKYDFICTDYINKFLNKTDTSNV
tara:strand:- start:40140 stop:40595 length:456 start_codon:yes stop_codon:yes gene_type:complete